MLDLFFERFTLFFSFIYIGMDVFGFFYIKEGRKELKRWGLIFICFVLRVIYLEIFNVMIIDSFLNVFRCFISRRGKVREFRFD